MASAIFHRLHDDESGIWGVLAMSAAAGILLALLALGLDVAAVTGGRVTAQAALGAALRAAAHDLVPASVASYDLSLDSPLAVSTFNAALQADLPSPLTVEGSPDVTVRPGPPPSIGASITVLVPLPVQAVNVPVHLSEVLSTGWSAR